MKNSVSAGGQKTEGSIVKENLESTFEVGLVAKACLDSPEAWEQFKRLGDSLVEQKLQAKQLEAQNQLLLEQKEQAEAETARIYQCNRNFHSHLYTASDIAKKLGITPNMVGRIANENGLKQDPIYGKLGKIQLDNGKWVNQFYYNEDALTIIKSMVRMSHLLLFCNYILQMIYTIYSVLFSKYNTYILYIVYYTKFCNIVTNLENYSEFRKVFFCVTNVTKLHIFESVNIIL